MRPYVSEKALRIISVIAREHDLQQRRYRGGYITQQQADKALVERLNAISQRDPELRQFLEGEDLIPKREDEDPDLPWAGDPRPPKMNYVKVNSRNGSEPDRVGGRGDEEWHFPMAGERVC